MVILPNNLPNNDYSKILRTNISGIHLRLEVRRKKRQEEDLDNTVDVFVLNTAA